jgi:uncharacterized protein YciI
MAMSLFVVRREAGPAWVDGKGAFEQPAVSDHAAFMDALANHGVVVVAGPVAGTEAGRIRVVLIASAAGEEEVRQRLADDPWESAGRLRTLSVEPWTLLVGADRLATPTA